MGATRFVNNIREEGTSVSFDLVVRDETNTFTFGGGRVTLDRAQLGTAMQIAAALDRAVENIIEGGNEAYPKVKPPAGEDPPEWVRKFRNYAVARNIEDRPSRRDPFGAR